MLSFSRFRLHTSYLANQACHRRAIILTKPAELTVRVSKKLSGAFTLDAEFQASPGVTILFGPSGAGKTILLHCVAGLHSPDAGRVSLGDRVLFDSQLRIDVPVRRRGTGYLFQTLALFPHLSVEQNVEYGLARKTPQELRRR